MTSPARVGPPAIEMTGDRPAIPQGLFAGPPTDGHTCTGITNDPSTDGKCVECEACRPFRLRHTVRRPDGTTHLVLRCAFCDGPDAHHIVKKEAD